VNNRWCTSGYTEKGPIHGIGRKKKKKRRKRKGENAIADEQPSTLGVQISKKSRVTGVHRGNYKAFYWMNSSMASMASRRA
jgi:hypothetical protein